MAMQIDLTPEQDSFVRQALASGRFSSAEDAVQEALVAWVAREPEREDLVSALREAEVSLVDDKGVVVTQQSTAALLSQIKQRGLARRAAAQSSEG